MSTAKNPEPQRHVATRQMLDELDALMERMLALPVQEPDPAELAALPDAEPLVSASLSLAEAEPPGEVVTELIEPPPAPAPECEGPPPEYIHAPAVDTVLRESSAPSYTVSLADEPAFAPAPPEPEPSAEPAPAQPPPPDRMLPPLIELKPPEPLARKAPNRPYVLWKGRLWNGLIWLNRRFDHETYRLGRYGRWLRTPRGRQVLGWAGVALFLLALVWGCAG